MHFHEGHNNGYQLHLFGMLINYVIAVALVLPFITLLVKYLKIEQHQLTELKAKAEQETEAIKLALLAIGSAHQLSTPLTTISILADELKHQQQAGQLSTDELASDLDTIGNEVKRCKTLLDENIRLTGGIRSLGMASYDLETYMHNVPENWHHHKKQGVSIIVESIKDYSIMLDQTFTQSLLSLFDNAVEADANEIHFHARRNQNGIEIIIEDNGHGLPEHQDVTEAFYTTKKDGKGLGLFLVKTLIEKVGGRFTIANRINRSGTATSIILPHAFAINDGR